MIYTTDGTPVAIYDTRGNVVLGGAGGSHEQDPISGPSEWGTLRHVTNNSAWWRGAAVTGTTGGHAVTAHAVRSPAHSLRIRMGQFPPGSTMIHKDGTPITGRASLVINGVTHPVTWGGIRDVSLPFGDSLLSDPLPDTVVIYPGDTVHSVWEASPGSLLPTGSHGAPTGTPGRRNATAGWDGTTTTSTRTIAGSPTQIIGYTDQAAAARSVLLIGDSFFEAGWGKTACENLGFAWSDVSLWIEPTPPDRSQLADRLGKDGDIPFDVVITGYGGNTKDKPLAEQQAIHISQWRWLESGGVKVGAMTLHPYTTSTDRWATVEGQTMTYPLDGTEGYRRARNAWARDGLN